MNRIDALFFLSSLAVKSEEKENLFIYEIIDYRTNHQMLSLLLFSLQVQFSVQNRHITIGEEHERIMRLKYILCFVSFWSLMDTDKFLEGQADLRLEGPQQDHLIK